MSSDQQLPLTRVRGVGPTAARRMAQCGIVTVDQLANLSIVQFKQTCPPLEKRAEAFVKGARRLLKRLERGVAADMPASAAPAQVLGGAEQLSPRVSTTTGETERVGEDDVSTGGSEGQLPPPDKADKQKKKKNRDGEAGQKKRKKADKRNNQEQEVGVMAEPDAVRKKKRKSDKNKAPKKSSGKSADEGEIEKKEKKGKKKHKGRQGKKEKEKIKKEKKSK